MPRNSNKNTLIYAGILGVAAVLATASVSQAAESYKGAGQQAKLQQVNLVTPNVHRTNVVIHQAYFGHAPYICTPSGYGQRAHCSLRASVHTSR